MPRRYQPPLRRRKAKKARTPGFLELPGDDHQAEVPAATARVTVAAAEPPARGEERHIMRDYSYVVNEVRRVVIVAGFIVISLVLTAVFLR